MPIYTYRAVSPDKSCDKCKTEFEVIQSIRDDAMKLCPDCGNPIVRLITAVKSKRDDSTKTILSDDNLKKHGFKKLVNVGDGKYDEVV